MSQEHIHPRDLREQRVELQEDLERLLGQPKLSEEDERRATRLADRIGSFSTEDRVGSGLARDIEVAAAAEFELMREADELQKSGGDFRTWNSPNVHVGGSEFRGLKSNESVAQYYRHAGVTDRRQGLSLGAVCRGMVGESITDVERRALSEGTDSAGGYTVPINLASQVIDELRAKSVVFQAGAMTVPLDTDKTDYARVATFPDPAWRAESAVSTDADPTFSRVRFDTKTLRVMFRASREVLADSANIDAAINTALSGGFAKAIDAGVLTSTGGDGPTGIIEWSTNVGTVNAGSVMISSSTTWVPFNSYKILTAGMEQLLVDDAPEPTAAIMAPRDYVDLGESLDTQNQPLKRPSILDPVKLLYTSVMPSTLVPTYGAAEGSSEDASKCVIGHFPHSMVGMRANLRIELLRERFADQFQYGFLAWLRMDHQLAHPESFCVISNLSPTATT